MTGFDLRSCALGLPHAEEVEHMGAPAFRVDGKIFAQLSTDERVALLKLDRGEQAALLAACAKHVWLPAHWGRFGWTYLRVDGFAASDVRKLVERSWSLIAPKRLAVRWSPAPDARC